MLSVSPLLLQGLVFFLLSLGHYIKSMSKSQIPSSRWSMDSGTSETPTAVLLDWETEEVETTVAYTGWIAYRMAIQRLWLLLRGKIYQKNGQPLVVWKHVEHHHCQTTKH
ncbi:hypothetical protein CPB84DRAFT_1745508 [Gymnopilus junonius]|uniref:Secreted protein n=1 Tax=Gymnopilus junonius TaxID=109634 RepID=A0A9P5TQX4_GYMJU|nr:hypothetical protein CPB84DRAFT_1745508 [Gymnopilus junonius]